MRAGLTSGRTQVNVCSEVPQYKPIGVGNFEHESAYRAGNGQSQHVLVVNAHKQCPASHRCHRDGSQQHRRNVKDRHTEKPCCDCAA